MRKVPSAKVLASWKTTILKHGSKRIKLRVLLQHFGLQRRGKGTETAISCWLKEADGGPFFAYGLDGFDEVSLDSVIELSDQEITRIGQFVSREQELMKRFVKDIMPHLGLRTAVPNYPPKGTRDRLDYLCEDESGSKVVVELKRHDGEKHGVEQIMRYIGLIKAEGYRRVRGILITGYADPHTRNALLGRHRDEHIDWWVYGLDGRKILVKRISVSSTPRPSGRSRRHVSRSNS